MSERVERRHKNEDKPIEEGIKELTELLRGRASEVLPDGVKIKKIVREESYHFDDPILGPAIITIHYEIFKEDGTRAWVSSEEGKIHTYREIPIKKTPLFGRTFRRIILRPTLEDDACKIEHIYPNGNKSEYLASRHWPAKYINTALIMPSPNRRQVFK
ncbi:MAG: hypothetical protein A2W22_06530 [Candidatus Levybacteria bacterium RBG_16_35_11]|nr:MAG: hypothetical protein A2W22_06530 [Candidatus Levybacteria bacterium RBG_16_35_11]